MWAKGTFLVLDFMQVENRDLLGRSWKLVKYEDLMEQPEARVRDVLPFLDTDTDTVDMAQNGGLPLRGSSVSHGNRDEVH